MLILNSFDEICKGLMIKQNEIKELHKQLKILEQENQQKVDDFVKPLQAEQDKLLAEIREKAAVYNALVKKEFGICDGEPADILQLVQAVKRVAQSV